MPAVTAMGERRGRRFPAEARMELETSSRLWALETSSGTHLDAHLLWLIACLARRIHFIISFKWAKTTRITAKRGNVNQREGKEGTFMTCIGFGQKWNTPISIWQWMMVWPTTDNQDINPLICPEGGLSLRSIPLKHAGGLKEKRNQIPDCKTERLQQRVFLMGDVAEITRAAGVSGG